jgi:hypothetical protein
MDFRTIIPPHAVVCQWIRRHDDRGRLQEKCWKSVRTEKKAGEEGIRK